MSSEGTKCLSANERSEKERLGRQRSQMYPLVLFKILLPFFNLDAKIGTISKRKIEFIILKKITNFKS